MFILTKISDLVTIPASDFDRKSWDVLLSTLNLKYSNRIIPQVGLGVTIHDILHIPPSAEISNLTGAANVNVLFRLIVFRPFKGEILCGQVGESGTWGMRIKLQFFEDVIVPKGSFFDGCEYDPSERCWVWVNEGQRYYFDKNDWVRVRVEEEVWEEEKPVAPNAGREADGKGEGRRSPYSIVASIQQAGLGVIDWW